MATNKKPIAKPQIVLREEFDDWAVLYDPDTGDSFGINPVGVFIWKLLDGEHNEKDILIKLRDKCKNVPEKAESEIQEFVNYLIEQEFAGFEGIVEKPKFEIDDKELTYEKPIVNILGASDSEMGEMHNQTPGEMGDCDVGQAAGYICGLGFSPAFLCGEGAGDDG